MLPLYLGLYLFVLLILWAFFFVARHHAYKFKGFSTNISLVTNILGSVLLVLTIVGFFCIFSLSGKQTVVSENPTQNYDEVYY